MSDGTTIAKRGLSDAMHERMRGYARGGVVSGGELESLSPEDRALAEQAAVEALDAQDAGSSLPAEPAPVVADPGTYAGGIVPPTDLRAGNSDSGAVFDASTATQQEGPGGILAAGEAIRSLPAVDLALAAGSALPVVGPSVAGMAGLGQSGVLNAPRQMLADFANGPPPTPVAPVGTRQGATASVGETAPFPVAPANASADVGQRTRTPGRTTETAPAVDPEQARALRAQQVAIDGAAAVEKARLANAAQQELDNAAALEARRAEYERQRVEIQGRAERLANDVASGRLDPNRLWNRLDTWPRIGNAISLMLGGIGSALAGGPNQALQVIEGAIDRDIESQKDERTRKEWLLQFHVQQGRDLTAAYSLAKADMMDIAAGKMRGAANRYGSMATAANALAASGVLAQKAIDLRAKALENDLDGKVKRAQIDRLRAESAESYAKIRASNTAQAGAVDLRDLKNKLVMGARVDPRALEQLPEADRKRVVQPNPGFYALAGSAEGAKAIETAQTMDRQMKPMVREYEAIRARHPHGWITGVGDYEDKGRAKTLYSALTTKLKDVLNLGVMSDSDRELLQQQIPNLVDFSPTAQYDAQLAQLGTNIDRALASVYDAHLMREAVGDRAEKLRPGGG